MKNETAKRKKYVRLVNLRQLNCSLLIAYCAFVIVGCEERVKPSVVGDLPSKELPSHESWNTTITFSDSGIIKAVLHVGHLAKYANEQTTALDGGIKVDFFNDRGEHTSILTALKGRVDDRTHDFEAIGNVVVVSDSGTTLQTERLFWNNASRNVRTEEYVKIISPKEEIQGHGFESDENLTNYKIFRVTGKTTMGK